MTDSRVFVVAMSLIVLLFVLTAMASAPEHTPATLAAVLGFAPLSPARVEAAGVRRRGVNVTRVVGDIAVRRAAIASRSSAKPVKPLGAIPRCERSSLNAAVQHRMSKSRDPMFPALVDKGHLRAVASALGERTPALLGLSQGCDGLPRVSELPSGWVLKARHTTGCTLVVADGRVVAHKTCNGGVFWLREKILGAAHDRFVGRPVSDGLLREACSSFTRELYVFALSEWAYSQLSPGVLIEELMRGPAATASAPATASAVVSAAVASQAVAAPLAEDLKCFVFHGATRFVLHVGGRLEGHKTDSVYDAETGELLDVTVKGSRRETDASRSVFRRFGGLLPELRRRCDADAAALGLDFVRVDFLLTEGAAAASGWQLLLGEVTLYPGGGGFAWEPPEFDEDLGAFLGKSCEHAPAEFVWQRLGRRRRLREIV